MRKPDPRGRSRPAAPLRMSAVLLLLVISACASATPAAAPAPATGPSTGAATAATTIYVFRHAERLSEDDRDSPLSEAGRARAMALAHALEWSGIEEIYVTQYRRTRETANPVAASLGVPIRTDTTSGGTEPARSLARRVLERHRGGTILIVGHSNTVPAIVHALGGPELPELASTRYGDLFILTILPDGTARTVRAQVGGAGDPRPASETGPTIIPVNPGDATCRTDRSRCRDRRSSGR